MSKYLPRLRHIRYWEYRHQMRNQICDQIREILTGSEVTESLWSAMVWEEDPGLPRETFNSAWNTVVRTSP